MTYELVGSAVYSPYREMAMVLALERGRCQIKGNGRLGQKGGSWENPMSRCEFIKRGFKS